MYYYDFKQQAFLVVGLHTIPANAKAVSEADFVALTDGRSKGREIVLIDDKLTLTPVKPSAYHLWDGQTWVLSAKLQQAAIFEAKSAKLAEINTKSQEYINQLTGYNDTPPFERDTWPVQREEAKAWFADNRTDTPNLARIALLRGVPLNELRNKAYQKAVAYEGISFDVAGLRQGYEDKLKAAQTLEQVQAIEVVYQLPRQAVQNG